MKKVRLHLHPNLLETEETKEPPLGTERCPWCHGTGKLFDPRTQRNTARCIVCHGKGYDVVN